MSNWLLEYRRTVVVVARLAIWAACYGGAFLVRFDFAVPEFFLQPLHRSREYRDATIRLLRSFDYRHVHQLGELHRRIDVPVQLVWGEHDRFFPVKWAEEMVGTFPDASLEVIQPHQRERQLRRRLEIDPQRAFRAHRLGTAELGQALHP